MKTLRNTLLAAASGLLIASCSLTTPVNATSNPVGSKVGKSSGTCYLTVLCFGADASIQTAAKNAGISKISTVDMTEKNVLGIIVTYETTVTGE